ncbi:MAG TPA: 2-oxo-tetronate isomerase [Terracidiphilus sp.]|nr:2-oxo-tetronate isomerase [Terracidiphilus sp.]
MPRFAANLTMMYQEHPFLDRFAAAAKDGFTAVEFLFPYEHPAVTIAALLEENGLQQVLFNAPPGNWTAGERGITALPGREEEFRAGFERALEYAEALKCPRIHAMAGLVPTDGDRVQMRETYVANLAWAAEKAHGQGISVLIEPIAQRNIPRFFLNLQQEAHAIAAEIGAPNLKILMDLFHCQVAEGDLVMRMRKYIADPKQTRVGHFQIAGVPERHEPDTGEVNYEYVFGVMDQLGFEGWVGCEYIPAAGTSAGLSWFKKYQLQR